jgi:hypothetical protein
MIVLRPKKICFLTGFMAKELGKHQIEDCLKSFIPELQVPKLRSDPSLGINDLKKIQKTKWDLVIGFSMGGFYATKVKSRKTFLINPGLNISEGMMTKVPEYSPGFKIIEKLPDLAKDVTGMIAVNDKIRPYIEPIFIERYGKENLIHFPGKHVPEIPIIEQFIIPEIKKIIATL